jgi:IS4 transposase
LDHLRLEAGSFYIMDRGYVHMARLVRFCHAGAFFVVRSKYQLKYRVVNSVPAPPATPSLVILTDESIELTGQQTHKTYTWPLRRIEFYLVEQDRHITLLTNHFELPASHVAELYKSRWQVELFFKWIKQNLRIKSFVGTSANAVKTQIWCAVCTYVVVAIVKKRLALEGSMHAILQVLSLSLFEVKPLAELLGEQLLNDETGEPEAQFCLFPEISGQ